MKFTQENFKRAMTLLKASRDLLQKADEAHFIEQATCILVHYDEADCDGSCLMDDINMLIEDVNDEQD